MRFKPAIALVRSRPILWTFICVAVAVLRSCDSLADAWALSPIQRPFCPDFSVSSLPISRQRPLAQLTAKPTDELEFSTVHSSTNVAQKSLIGCRDGHFTELGQVADMILQSFYTKTATNNVTISLSTPWRQMYRIGELNRLQQSFPYGDRSAHRMLVAVAAPTSSGGADTVQRDSPRAPEIIVGFCDVDARYPNRPTSYRYNPRPYLSDLCVHPKYRRQGVASALIQASEEFCVSIRKKELFIRVESNNDAAMNMYRNLGYHAIDNPDDPRGAIILLHKLLKCSS